MRLCACCLLLLLGGLTGPAALSSEPDGCDQPEACFQAAVLPKERLGKGMSKEQVLTLKLERLQRVMDRFPDSVWSKRAGLLSGVLSIDRNPASAIPLFRSAQRDFPVLDDYIRLWIAQAQLNL